MDVFISADMEGVSGIAGAEDVVPSEPAYDRGTELLHADVNAAVAGAVAGGGESIVVNDSHGSMRNLDRDRLDDLATLIRGDTKPRSMMQGLTADHDVALFVGYHAKAGTPAAVLNHTFFGHELIRLTVNGTEVGEIGWNARLAGALGVPVGLVTGDDATIAEANAELPDPETVAVKEGIDRFTAACRPTAETGPEIETAARRAVQRVTERAPTALDNETPTTITAAWTTTNQAARAACVPGVERTGGRQTAVTAERYTDAFEAAVGMLRTGVTGTDQHYG